MTPRRVETHLLVVAPFKDANGTQYVAGDRVSLGHRSVREAAFEDPSRFRMEYETSEVDVDWLRGLDASYEQEYQAELARRGRAKERREQAVRDELKAQDAPGQRDLERRFAQQEKQKKERRKAARDEQERRKVEAGIAFGRHRAGIGVGFNYED